jgi:ribonucleotide monophosphatase NagD (HAD superfamily)
LIAAIENASGVKAKVVGKPHAIVMEAAFLKL